MDLNPPTDRKIAGKIEQLNEYAERIDAVIKDVISLEETTTAPAHQAHDEIHLLIKKWTIELQTRYKVIVEIEAIEDVEFIVLDTIKHCSQTNETINICEQVNGHLQETFENLDTVVCQKDILLNILVSNSELPHLTEINDITALRNSLVGDELIQYKIKEFEKLKSLICGNEEEIFDNHSKTVEDISKKLNSLSKSKHTDEYRKLEEEYGQFCEEKVKNIIHSLTFVENSFGVNFEHFRSVLLGQERLYSNNFHRHTSYDKISAQLELSSTYSCTNEEMEKSKFIKELKNIQEEMIAEQLEAFFLKCRNEDTNTIQNAEETILDIVATYCSNGDNNLNADELQYQLKNVIELGKLNSNKLYTIANTLTDVKNENMGQMKWFLVAKADRLEFKKIEQQFMQLHLCQKEQYKKVAEAKTTIADEFGNYCGIMDRSVRDNYVDTIRLYLDMLDWLVGQKNDDNISKREETLTKLQIIVKKIIENSGIQAGDKAASIESAIAEELSQVVFSNCKDLKADILDHFETFSTADTVTEYQRKDQTGDTVALQDLFSNSGRFKDKERRELFLQNKTVIASVGTYYRLADDIHSLKQIPDTYKKSVVEFEKLLSSVFKEYKLTQLKITIKSYDENKNVKNLIELTKDLVYFLSLVKEHLDTKRSFEGAVESFLKIYNETIKNLMMDRNIYQDVITELMDVIDTFSEDVVQQKIDKCKVEKDEEQEKLNNSLLLTLKSLRATLSYKTYKESGFKLFTEEQHQFSQMLASKIPKRDRLMKIIQKDVPEILWLRSLFPVMRPQEFFASFQQSINNLIPNKEIMPSDTNIEKLEQIITSNKNEIVFSGLLDEEANVTIDNWTDKLKSGELSLKRILKNIETQSQLFKKLRFILQEYSTSFTDDHLEELFLVLSSKPWSELLGSESFPMYVLRLYGKSLVAKKNSKLTKAIVDDQNEQQLQHVTTSVEILEAVITNTIRVYEIDQNACRKKAGQEYVDHFKALEVHMPDLYSEEVSIDEIINSLEEIEIQFIVDILNTKNAEDFQPMSVLSSNKDLVKTLPLILQLPNSFFKDQKIYLEFMESLIKTISGERRDLEYFDYIRDIIYRYYILFLDKMMCTKESASKELLQKLGQRKADIMEAMNRLYDNVSSIDFIKYAEKWLGIKNGWVIENFVIKSLLDENSSKVGLLLSKEEIQHLQALLSFEIKNDSLGFSTNNAELVMMTLNEKKFETRSTIKVLRKMFTATFQNPITTWKDNLIELRTNTVVDGILNKFSDSDGGTTKLTDVVNAFVFFNEQSGTLMQALFTLDLICENVCKFSTLEEVKQSMMAILKVTDLDAVNDIIKKSDKHQLKIDLIFFRINAVNNKRLKTAIDKLKLILSYREFEKVNFFCRLFLIQAREQQHMENLLKTIELILDSKAYGNSHLLKVLQDKDMSLWDRYLEKAIIHEKLNTKIFDGLSAKQKNKATELLYQIREEKGKLLHEIVLAKINGLKERPTFQNLNLILKKIIHKSYVFDAIHSLSTDINDWNETLFPSNTVSSGKPLTIKQLLMLMQVGDKISQGGINECVKSCIRSVQGESQIEKVLNEARNLEKHSKFFDNSKIIAEWQEDEITKWSKCFSGMSAHHNEVYYWNTTESIETIGEVLSVIIRAVIIYDHHPYGPRDTQLMALLLFLDNGSKGRLGNIFTGEGKTLITVMLATCLGLMGKRVDVVTSSKLLAIRDSKERPFGSREGYAGFYEMFGCKASNNCDEECEKSDTGESERKSRYSRCNIMYGETGYFQRDILLTQFFRKDIRRGGNSIGDILILDEVDSMMIDNAAKTLYISHNITDVRYVKDIFLHIWAAVNSKEERHYSEENVAKIVEYINKITANDESGDLHVSIPSTLKHFVQFNLKTWIESAYNAKYIKENDAYIIGDEESQLKNEIIIMDKDTGVEQRSTKWSNGQHQFIQLKHSGKLSDESLKAVFISNSGYFQMYAKLYGMTGTVGEDEERKLLNQIYGIDFFEMPRFKEYRFEYDFESECIAQTKDEWLQNIVDNVDDTMNQSFNYSNEFKNAMKEKFDTEQQCFQKLDSQSKTLGKELERLEKQRAECEQLADTYESIVRLSRAIISLCTEASVETFMAEIQSIGGHIDSLQSFEDVDTAKDVNALQCVYRMLPATISEYSIEQFGRTFKENINTSEMASLGNRKKMQLETLISLFNKEQTKIDFVNEAKAKSSQDMEFYERESKCTAQSAKRNCKRAVLIICDNIADLNIIEAELRRKLKNPKADPTDDGYKIYKYDRAYKRFDVSCLEMGDIVVATNIAGRGTDLEVSKEVEENGGLHVILSYIPKNFRIEKQAFGRTSRAGNKGTGTYIVLDDRKEFEDIAQLQKERNEEESRRLGLVLNEQLPKIHLEDELFKKFNVLQHSIEIKVQDKYKSFKRKKEYRSKTPTELQLDSLKNKWALWLNLISDKIGKVNVTGENEILSEYNVFESEIYKNVQNRYGLIVEPGELTKLGRCYLDNEQYSAALNIFDYIVRNHASFSGIAEYYKTFCVIHLDGGGHDAKVKAKAALKRSLRLLEADRTRILSRNQILKSINDLTRIGGKGMDSNLFAKQNEGEAQILSIHINAINSAIGYEVTPDCFNGVGIVGDQSQKIFDTLLSGNYDILKNYRISKKIFVGCKVLIKDREKQNIALTGNFKDLDEWLKKALGEDFIIFNDISSFEQYENYKKSLEILQRAQVISTAEIFKRLNNNGISVSNSKNITFPDSFSYCKDKVLDDLVCSMIDSRNQCGWYKKREKSSSSFEDMIYTKEKFLHDADKIIRTENIFEISSSIKNKLLGKLDHPVYCGKGNQIKHILTSQFLRLDYKFLEEKLNKIQNDDERFFGKLANIKQFLLGVGGESGDIETLKFLNGESFTIKDDIVDSLEKIVTLPTDRPLKDDPNFKELLCYLNFNLTSSVIPADQLNELIINKTSLNGSQVKEILSHLEFYIQLHVDHNFLEQKFKSVKNEMIFLGKMSEIREFCLGKRQVDIGGGKTLQLIDNQSVGKCDIVRALKLITKISDDSSASIKSNFDALQIHLGLDAGTQLEAVRSYKQYVFHCESYNDKIKTYLQTFNLKDLKSDEISGKIDRLDLSVDSRLQKSSAEIVNVLRDNLQIDLQLNKENFNLDEDAFEILAAILTDANIISRSLFALLNGNEENAMVNPEMETILMRMFHAQGVIAESDIILRDAKQGSKELFSRLLEFHVIKPPKVNFPLGRAKFVGGNNWEESSDPAKKLQYIKEKIEMVVKEVFKLERKDDLGHTINEYITGGIGTESKNKDLDEKIETITNAIKSVAGVIKTVPQVKIETKDLRSMFGSGRVPPELMDYIHMSFDAVLEYKEHKGFDWDCFLCAMIGVAQIVAGVAIEVLSGGTAHFIAQALISEGIGDIVFAIQAGIEGNFSWKSYRKHKVQSIMLTIVTGGVGAYLSKGAEAGKIAVGLATKTALFKAIAKTAIVEVCTAVSMSIVNIGAEEISKVIVEEIANVHFVQYFEKFIKEDSAYLKKTTVFERRLNNFYEKFGTTAVRQSVDACLESCLNQMACGALGNQIFNKVSSLMGSVTRACSNAANRFQKGSSKAKILGSIATFIGKTFQLAEYTKNFGQLCTLCNDFYDLAIKELDALERSLVDQQKNGTLNISTEQIAQDKVLRSFSDEAKSVSKEAERKMHTAFILKIKNGFVQPAVSSMLHMAVKPIQQLITAPFSNAMDQLQTHVDMRAELKLKDIMEQNPERISRLTSRQKKALELRGDIFLAEDIDNSDILKASVANFPGETIESLRKEHGPNVGIVIKDNEIYVVLPTFNQFADNIINGKVNVVGGLQRKIAANLAGRGIDVVNENIDGSESFEHHEKVPETIKPMGGVKNGENYKIAFIEGGEGKVGHYAPVIKDKDGKWKVIKNLAQEKDTKDACFGQCMIFLKEFEKKGETEARSYAENSVNVTNYYKELGKHAKHNDAFKELYLSGLTVKRNRLVGGDAGFYRSSKLENVFNTHSYSVQIRVIKRANASNDEDKENNIGAIEEQLAYVPFMSPEGQNENITCMGDDRRAAQLENENRIVRLHIINARVGGPADETNLFLGTASMNSMHYKRFEHHMLEFLRLNARESGGLYIKTKIGYQSKKVAHSLDISVGTNNPRLQRKFEDFFKGKEGFQPHIRKSGRIDYKLTLTTSEEGRRKTIPKHCDTEWQPSSEYDNLH